MVARRSKDSATAWSEEVFSYHERVDCHGRRWKVPLEPLVGLLRDPRFHCLKMQRIKLDAAVRDDVALSSPTTSAPAFPPAVALLCRLRKALWFYVAA